MSSVSTICGESVWWFRNITVKTGTNQSAWTLDKHGTNAHDAFFYIECICNAWFTIEIIVR